MISSAELEKENAEYQEQILRAHQKIKADQAMHAKLKKVLAIGLTLTDEQSPDENSE